MMSEEYEDLLEKHRKEKKELREKIIGLKRASNKKDKKKLQDEIAQMEKDLIDRQADELSKLKIDDNQVQEDNSEEQSSDVKSQDEDPVVRKSKAQRRREKKEQESKKREIEIQQGEEENKKSARQLEVKALNKVLKARNLTLSVIKSDGDCLYNSIRHQLELHNIFYSIDTLRKIAADYIRSNKDELICYMPSSRGDDIMSQAEFEDYCNQVENTKAWGSQIEIQALSNALKLKIEVLQAQGRPTISGADFPNAPHLIVTYHRHFYGLGEHYNSTVTTRPSTNASENETK